MHLRLDRDSILIYLSDIHIPYHDPKAVSLAVEVIRLLSPNIIFLGGDIIDFYPLSHFSKDPVRKQSLQYELDLTHQFLANKIRKHAPNARIFFQNGNHCARLTKYLWNHAEGLNSLRGLTVPELLQLSSLDIKWLSQEDKTYIGELGYFHGDEFASGGGVYPARNIFMKAPGNIIMGHWHRITAHYYRMLNGKTYGAWSNGCLCTLQPEYLHFPQWQQGITIVRYNKSGLFHVSQIVIFQRGSEYYCMVDGKLLTTAHMKPKPKNKSV